MDITFASHINLEDILVIGINDDLQFLPTHQTIDKQTFAHIEKAIKVSSFKGKALETFLLPSPQENQASAIICVGFGKQSELTLKTIEEIGAKIFSAVSSTSLKKAFIDIQNLPFEEQSLAALASGIFLRNFKFDKYKTKNNNKDKGPSEIVLLTPSSDSAQKAYHEYESVNLGNILTRDVVSEPPNVLYPETMAQKAKELTSLGLEVEVLNEEEMKKLGMNALLGVGQGSMRESQLIVLQWKGGPADQAPIAIVGKGVTFDSGGISIKPSANMEDMKYDMAGSGVVIGLMKALALRKAKVNVVGIMGMVENMPSGSAQRPADVVTSMSGQTIEVVNTDAEGRLVLADALWYTQDRFKPKAMIDLATLTGAITVALGQEYAGLFSNNDELSQKLTDSGLEVGEPLWRLPLGKQYDKDIDSDIADVKNVGSGRGAGSITAAQFLQRFVNNVPWAHLDIAGMAWDKKDKPLTGKGATGYGVRLLNHFIKTYYE